MNPFKSASAAKAQKEQEVSKLLVQGEQLEHLYASVFDYASITSHRLLFVDKHHKETLKTMVVGVPFRNITGVCLKRGGMLSFTKTVIIQVGNRDIDIDFFSSDDALELFKNLSSKVLKA